MKLRLTGRLSLMLLLAPFVLARPSAADTDMQAGTAAAPPIRIGEQRQLFVDRHLLDRVEDGAQLRLHKPEAREIVMVNDKPWANNGGMFTVFKDRGIYRMYYRAMVLSERDERTGRRKKIHGAFTCYAESLDGIHWTRPDLGLVEFNGSRNNNILMEDVDRAAHNFTPFKDPSPNAAPEARYKAVGGSFGGLYAFQSPDGIHWQRMQKAPVLTDGAFDSQNVAFWDPVRQEYRAYYRAFTGGSPGEGRRAIKTATSDDFIHWTKGTFLQYPGAPEVELYTNAVQPYQRAPHVFIGFPARYIEQRGSVVEPLLMASRDARTFNRWEEAIMRPGLNRDRWQPRSNYAWSGLVQTRADLPSQPRELSLYSAENHGADSPTRLRRYTYRLDGFVSLSAPMAGGTVVTKPLVFEGDQLVLNFSTSAAGSVSIEVLNAAGEPIADWHTPAFYGDQLEYIVPWRGHADIAELAGQPIRLRFTLKDADVYSLRFKSSDDE